jgi:hypothetical protein
MTSQNGLSENQKGRPFSGDGPCSFLTRLGPSPAHRPAYDAERVNAKDDDRVVQPDRHTASIADRQRISKYN